ncbi:hypothetical protein [Nocardia sp. NPDC006630]|uniref:hypothetical protein n=1 Tax=Nocardia sp. NPDC006630 TaxID=3157181 RepID=UPI00339FF397
MRWLAVLVEFVLTPVLVITAVWFWHKGIHTGWFAASGDAPGYTASRYSGPWLAGAAVVMTAAGLVLLDLVARVFRLAR